MVSFLFFLKSLKATSQKSRWRRQVWKESTDSIRTLWMNSANMGMILGMVGTIEFCRRHAARCIKDHHLSGTCNIHHRPPRQRSHWKLDPVFRSNSRCVVPTIFDQMGENEKSPTYSLLYLWYLLNGIPHHRRRQSCPWVSRYSYWWRIGQNRRQKPELDIHGSHQKFCDRTKEFRTRNFLCLRHLKSTCLLELHL